MKERRKKKENWFKKNLKVNSIEKAYMQLLILIFYIWTSDQKAMLIMKNKKPPESEKGHRRKKLQGGTGNGQHLLSWSVLSQRTAKIFTFYYTCKNAEEI